jgi:peptide/nickel transport system substrate-binding protein
MQARKNWTVLASMAIAGLLGTNLATMAAAQDNTAITIVMPEEPPTLDSCDASKSQVGRIVKGNVFETLVVLNPADGSLQPRLATSWEQIDELTLRFHLVEGVTFHDGEPFNAEAVAFNLTRAMNESVSCFNALVALEGYDVTTNIIDDYTIDVITQKPAPILATSFAVMTMASPNTSIEGMVRDPVGTGPYVFSEWIPSERIVLTRNDEYWGAEPEVTEVTYVFRGESAVRAAMVETGEADLTPVIAMQDADDPSMDFSYLNSETVRLRIDTRYPPLDDVRMRQALNYAVDREALLGSVVSPESVIATQYVPPGTNGFNTDLVPYAYDPERAAELVAEAAADGVDTSAEIVLMGRIDNFPNVAEFLEATTAMFQAAGLNVRLEMLEAANHQQYQVRPMPEGIGPNLFEEMHDNARGDAYFTVYNKYHSNGGASTLSDPELDALIERADAATGDERREAYEEAFRIIHEDDVADVMMFHMVGYTRVGPRINYTPTIATNSEVDLASITFKD